MTIDATRARLLADIDNSDGEFYDRLLAAHRANPRVPLAPVSGPCMPPASVQPTATILELVTAETLSSHTAGLCAEHPNVPASWIDATAARIAGKGMVAPEEWTFMLSVLRNRHVSWDQLESLYDLRDLAVDDPWAHPSELDQAIRSNEHAPPHLLHLAVRRITEHDVAGTSGWWTGNPSYIASGVLAHANLTVEDANWFAGCIIDAMMVRPTSAITTNHVEELSTLVDELLASGGWEFGSHLEMTASGKFTPATLDRLRTARIVAAATS